MHCTYEEDEQQAERIFQSVKGLACTHEDKSCFSKNPGRQDECGVGVHVYNTSPGESDSYLGFSTQPTLQLKSSMLTRNPISKIR